jgi:two-component system response regulator RegX3
MVVLLVEDEESFSDPLSYMLHKQGFEVIVCRSGRSALETFGRRGADLVLLGLMFAAPLGAEVCRRLRQRSDVPVIMLTTSGGEAGKAAAREDGASDCMAVPFTCRELLARMAAVLSAREDSGEVPMALVT